MECDRLSYGGRQRQWDSGGCWLLNFVGGTVQHVRDGSNDESGDDDGHVGPIVCEVTRLGLFLQHLKLSPILSA